MSETGGANSVAAPVPRLLLSVEEAADVLGIGTVATLMDIATAQPSDARTAASKIGTTPAAGATVADIVGAQETANTAPMNASVTDWIVEVPMDGSTYAERGR